VLRVVCAALLSLVIGGCGRDSSPVIASHDEATAAHAASAPAQATRLDALTPEGVPSGFTFAMEPKPFEFPRDHGPHSQFRHEWWYVTGHLDAETGQRFGFELTFFRFALAAPPSADSPAAPLQAATEVPGSAADVNAHSAWRTRQIYMAHFAVTDLDRGQFQASEKYARDALGMAGAQAAPFRVWLDDWSLGTPPEETGPEGSSYWLLRAADKGYAFDLQLRAVTPPVLNGDEGLSRKSDDPGAASYYYSIPRLAAAGRIVRDGKPLEVQGLAWLDREWGSGALGANQQGWDWFALQFDDGSTLMFYALRTRDGQRDPHSAGTWFAPDGATHPLANEDMQIDVKDYWNSPRGGRYPARWQLRVPSLKLDVEVRPRLADQELDTSPRYWEGAATITGTRAGNDARGRAYVELVGYAGAR
jgi:predicted secreted hydrolase